MAHRAIGQERFSFADRRRTASSLDEIGKLIAGDIVPKRQGGDHRSQRIEAHSQLILGAVTVKPDITLA